MEFKAKKKMPSRADTFVITHTKKDGEAADPKSKEIMAKIKERQEQNPEPESSGIPSRDDLFGQLMGEETRGRVHMLGFFATPSTTLGTATRPPQPRGNSLHLNTKMAQLEQVNAIMAEELTQVKQQMSQILTHLQGVSPNYSWITITLLRREIRMMRLMICRLDLDTPWSKSMSYLSRRNLC
ncbi:uncharacterized protein LOC143855088 isoform X5 [Tasmannia lanceolata]|uniref:uncharacterized protein LOC143855088 isoform X5 n=1 Tax=Tasmannia lanceolata TaxID=3420 RepID=UPI004064970F